MAGIVETGVEGGIVDGRMLQDILSGSAVLEPRAQLEALFPRLVEDLIAINIEILELGCDRYQNMTPVDQILRRGRVYVRQRGYQKIFDMVEPKFTGGALFLECRIYLVNGFEDQGKTIGVAVGDFFKAAYERDVPQQSRWNDKGFAIYHYLAIGECPKNAKVVILATIVGKNPSH
jgi:hypothetical protein